jgi:hypothetical protein
MSCEELGGRRESEGHMCVAPAQVVHRRTQPTPAAVNSVVASDDMADHSVEHSSEQRSVRQP